MGGMRLVAARLRGADGLMRHAVAWGRVRPAMVVVVGEGCEALREQRFQASADSNCHFDGLVKVVALMKRKPLSATHAIG